jgi:hypothetical protein
MQSIKEKNMAKIGIIEVTVKLLLEMDVDEEDARDIVENCDYHFTHPLIQETEIMADDISERIEIAQMNEENA